jgi:hypothetical protein
MQPLPSGAESVNTANAETTPMIWSIEPRIDGDSCVAAFTQKVDELLAGGSLGQGAHVDAWHHDFLGQAVLEIHHRVDHFLFFFFDVAMVGGLVDQHAHV